EPHRLGALEGGPVGPPGGAALADREPEQHLLGAGAARARGARGVRTGAARPQRGAAHHPARGRRRAGARGASGAHPPDRGRRRGGPDRLRDRRERTDRLRRLPLRADRRTDRGARHVAAAARGRRRRAAGAGRGPRGPVRHRDPLSRGRGHRRAGCALPAVSHHPRQPSRELAVTADHTLQVQDLTLGYGERTVIEGLDLDLLPGRVTAIVGANACGKSTLLRSMSRLLTPRRGQVLLDGQQIHRMPAKQLARLLGLLPHTPLAPEGIAVADLVGTGRHPHPGLLSRRCPVHAHAVAAALDLTRTAELAQRPVDELSGGQRQRVWIAMALAQDTDVLLLDEPTTFLDVAHQIEVLDLLTDLNRVRGTTIVMVLHDL